MKAYMCFATSGLTKGETSGHAPVEDRSDERLGSVLVHHPVVRTLVKRVVKPEQANHSPHQSFDTAN